MQNDFIYQVVKSDVSPEGKVEIRHCADMVTAFRVAKNIVMDELKALQIEDSTYGFVTGNEEDIMWRYHARNTYTTIFLFKRRKDELSPELLAMPLTEDNTPLYLKIPVSFQENAMLGFEGLRHQPPVTIEEARAQAQWLRDNSTSKNKRKR